MPLELLGFLLTRSDISADAERYSPFFGRFRLSEGPQWGVGSEVENEKKETVWVLRMKEKLQGCNSSFSNESQLFEMTERVKNRFMEQSQVYDSVYVIVLESLTRY